MTYYHGPAFQRLTSIKWMLAITYVTIAVDLFIKASVRILNTSVLDYPSFELGRYIGGGHFAITYGLILIRVFFRDHKFINGLILSTILGMITLGIVIALYCFSMYHHDQFNFLQWQVNGLYFRQAIKGAASWIPTIGFLMVLMPLLIPSQQLQLIVQLFSNKASTGVAHFDQFLEARKKRRANVREIQSGHDVLLVEDDLTSATLVLKFCKKLKLECHHFESIQAAMTCFHKYEKHWKVVILDNFVRVDQNAGDGPKTGADWAKELNQHFPKGKRRFQLALLTGHSHMVENLSDCVDFILQKPWNPKDLFKFLKEKEVI